jgi:hypothetical protein
VRIDPNLRAEGKGLTHRPRPGFAWTFLIPVAERPKLVALFIVTLLVGMLSSATAQKAAICAVIAVIVLGAVYLSKRHATPESGPRRVAAGTPRRCSSTLLLRTITHLSRVELLIRRPHTG